MQLKDENPECIFYLPLGTNVDRWDQAILQGEFLTKEKKWLYDVSLVGSLYTEKSPYDNLCMGDFDRGFVDGLIEAQLKLPGLSLISEVINENVIKTLKEAKTRDGNSPWKAYELQDAFINTDSYVATNYYLAMRASELERIRLLNMLATDTQVHLFTRSDTSALKGVKVHGGVSTHQEMPIIFNRSKINLNITIRSIQTGLSQRVWDVLGCGGFLLTNYQMEIPEYLEIGKDLDCFENAAELKEKVAYYLEHEEERIEIAKHGYETVKSKHTCKHQVAEIFKIG